MASTFYIWTTNFAKRSACSYYRIEVPMHQLGHMGLANIYEDVGDGRKDSGLAMLYSDIVHWYAIAGKVPLHRIQSLKRVKPGRRAGMDLFPPACIYDIDDNNDFVHPFNMTYAHMGTRGFPDARLLKPGEGLVFRLDDGEEKTAWVDGETQYEGVVFDIARNLHEMKIRHQITREAHGVTVSTPKLADYMRSVIGAKHVYVFPNTVVPDHYEKIRAVRTDPDVVRVLWQGGMSHLIDWYPLRDAVQAISKKYRGKMKWVIYGEWFNWIHEVIPDEMVEHYPWDDYNAYKLKRGLLNADINLCPLADNIFNTCKSAIKWYESILWEKPEATLAARTAPYAEIADGETGLLYSTPEEFVEKLSLLIENPELRARLGDNAKKWVLDNRTPEKTIPGLFDFYTEVRARQKRELGAPIIKPATMDEIKKVASRLA